MGVYSGRRNGQALATLCAAPLENEPAILGRHPDKKAVSALAVPPVRLERTFHGAGSLQTTENSGET